MRKQQQPTPQPRRPKRATQRAALTRAVQQTTAVTAASNHPLLLLPAVLFCLICGFLTIPDKLLCVIQLNHAFKAALNKYCFRSNHLIIRDNKLIKRLKKQGQANLLALVSALHLDVVGSSAFSSSVLSMFPRLSAFACGDGVRTSLLPSTSAFHHLSDLALYNVLLDSTLDAASFPLLSSITLETVYFDYDDDMDGEMASMMVLLTLPTLTSIRCAHSYWSDSILAALPWQQLRTFRLELYPDNDDFSRICNPLLQRSAPANQYPLEYLEIIGTWTVADTNAVSCFLLLFPALVTLDLSELTLSVAGISLPDSSVSFLPHLRHLLLPTSVSDDGPELSAQLDFNLLQRCRSQLTVMGCQLRSESRPASGSSLFQLVCLVFSFLSLRKLDLRRPSYHPSCKWRQQLTAAVQVCSFLHLHCLTLHYLDMTLTTLACLFAATPQLIDCDIADKSLSMRIISEIGLHCEYIRSIRLQSRSDWSLRRFSPPTQLLNTCSFVPFSHLLLLHVCTAGKHSSPAYATPGLTRLLHMLRLAPLNHVTLQGHDLTCQQLSLFESFNSLHSLNVSTDCVRDAAVAASCPSSCFNYYYDSKYLREIRVRPERGTITDSVPQSLEQLVAVIGGYSFRQSVIPGHEHADRQGREAFFYDLKQHIQQDCGTKKQSNKRQKTS